jgi:putative membrane protein
MGLGMGLGLLLMLAFWAALVLGAAWLVKAVFSAGESGRSHGATGRPREILDERYARGEISREEYERIRKDLEV